MRTLMLASVAIALTMVSAQLAQAQDAPRPSRPEYVDPVVYSATEATRGPAERPLPGQFAFIVKGSSRDGDRVFLNSAVDYRDPGTLTVVLPASVADGLARSTSAPMERDLLGRTIVVNGVARRVPIAILRDGTRTGQTYEQTHVVITDASQIHIVPGPRALYVSNP